MQDPKFLALISKHISGKETSPEKEELLNWLDESEKNKTLYNMVKKTWEDSEEESITFRKKFTRKNITHILVQQTLGNFIGFAVGIWVTNSFTHYVTEKRSIKNLFGLAGRKQVLVNETPEWIQYGLSIILGFITLELINYFFQTKQHVFIWDYIKKGYTKIKNNNRN